jgi:hypothetical protein
LDEVADDEAGQHTGEVRQLDELLARPVQAASSAEDEGGYDDHAERHHGGEEDSL